MIRTIATIAAATMALAPPATADVTLINIFEVPPGQEARAIAAWEAARDFLSGQEGYIDTRLHRALDPEARFALVNVARWESADAFRAAMARMQAAAMFPGVDGMVVTPALYRVIRDDAGEVGD